MIDSRSIFGPASIYALTSGLTAAVPLLLLPVLTRLLSPPEYGLVAMFSVVVSVLGAITGLSVHGAIGVRYFERSRYDLPRYVTTCVLILACSAALTVVLVWAGSPWLEALTQIPPLWLVVAVVVASSQFIIQIRLVIWQCASQPWRFGALRILQAVVDASASLVMVVALAMTWEGRAGGFALAAVFAGLVALVSLYRGGWLTGAADAAYARDALKFGVPLIPHTVGGLLLVMVDRFLITNLLDVASTGVYMVALQVGMVLAMLVDAFNKAFAPWLMKSLGENNPARDRALVRFTYACFAGLIAIAAALGAAAPWLMPVLAGEEFRAAGGIVIYIAFGQAFVGMYVLVANYIFFAARTARLAAVSLAAGLFNAAASYWLVRHNGVTGAAQAFMLAQLMLFLGTWYVAQRVHPMPWRAIFASPSYRGSQDP